MFRYEIFCILFCFIVFCFVLLYFVLFYIVFCFVLLYFVLFYIVLVGGIKKKSMQQHQKKQMRKMRRKTPWQSEATCNAEG